MATYVVRTLKSGLKKVKVMVRRKNASSLTQTFQTRHQAEAWAMSIEGELLMAQTLPRVEAVRHTVADAIRRYKEIELARKTRKHKDQVAQLDWWAKELGHLQLAKLTGPLICQCRDKLASGTTVQGKPRQPATVNRYLATLSHVLSVAMRDWGWLEDSPMFRVRKLKEPRGRVRYLSDVDRARFLDVCSKSNDPYLYTIVLLALTAGMRRGEIINLRWTDIDWERRRLVLEQTKNGDRRAVPLVPVVMDRLHKARAAVGLIFPSVKPGYSSKPWDFNRGWKRALREAEIKDFRFHDLRHCCASYLAMNGATTGEIAEVLGHRTLSMVKRYAHLCDSHIAELVNRVSNRIIAPSDSNA